MKHYIIERKPNQFYIRTVSSDLKTTTSQRICARDIPKYLSDKVYSLHNCALNKSLRLIKIEPLTIKL